MINRGTQSKEGTLESDKDVISEIKILALEVERSGKSWQLFHESVRRFEDDQKDLIDTINARNLGSVFNHLQMVLLPACVSSICRITDEHRPDRVTLNSVFRELRSKFGDSNSSELKLLETKRKAILKSHALEELRRFRNHHIGHTIRTEIPPTKYEHISPLNKQIADLLSEALCLFGYPEDVVQPNNKVFEKNASLFWSCIERGAKEDGLT